MPVQLPYLSSYKNVLPLFDKIATARIPDTFHHKFLLDTIGLKSTDDRPLIPFLRTLGFVDASGKATATALAEAGATPHEIGAITGHTSLKEIERYTKVAQRSGMATQGMSKIEVI